MTLHLVKLCVGCPSLEDLAEWQRERLAEARAAGKPAELCHVTRQTPRREGFAAKASSLYWVIGGYIRARQRILDIRETKGADGIPRCAIVYEPALIATEPQPRRPFQGWRYLPDSEAPADLPQGNSGIRDSDSLSALPPKMRAELRELRLI